MFGLLYQFGLKWLYYKDPMTETESQRWNKTREKGIVSFVLLWSAVISGVMVVPDFCWNLFVEHKRIDLISFALRVVAYFFAGSFFAAIDWYVNESRYKQPKEHQVPIEAQIK